MRDLIDERDFKEKCKKSILKGYNVHYVTQEELEAAMLATNADAEDNDPKEENASLYQSNENVQEDFDSSLAEYGMTDDEDPVTKEQIEKILREREEKFMETLDELIE